MFSASADFFSTGDTTIRIEVAENILGRFSVDLHGWKLEYPHHVKKAVFRPADFGRARWISLLDLPSSVNR